MTISANLSTTSAKGVPILFYRGIMQSEAKNKYFKGEMA